MSDIKIIKPIFLEPRKSGRLSIVDKYGDVICKCESEYARDTIFRLIDAELQSDLVVGDVVEPVGEQFQLASGCARYDHAIVVSLSPFILVSECTTMRWQSTVTKERFRKIGEASDGLIKACMERI